MFVVLILLASCKEEPKHSSTEFNTYEKDGNLLIEIDNQLIGIFINQGDHFKFALTGSGVPHRKALIQGSISGDELSYLWWDEYVENGAISYDWIPDRGIESYSRSLGIEDRPVFPHPIVGDSQ